MQKIGNVIDKKWHYILDSIMPGGDNWDNKKIKCKKVCPGYKTCTEGGPDDNICTDEWKNSDFNSMNIGIVFHAINYFDFYNQNDIPDLNRKSQEIKELVTHIFDLKGKIYETSDDDDEFGVGVGVENLEKLHVHKKIERNQDLARKAKEFHGYTCKVCKFSFEKTYKEIGENFIEAHHLIPLSKLSKQKIKEIKLDPSKDFTVLCSNCHKMIHKTKYMDNIDEFRNRYLNNYDHK